MCNTNHHRLTVHGVLKLADALSSVLFGAVLASTPTAPPNWKTKAVSEWLNRIYIVITEQLKCHTLHIGTIQRYTSMQHSCSVMNTYLSQPTCFFSFRLFLLSL